MNQKLPIKLKKEHSHVTKSEYFERKAAELPLADTTIVIPDSLKTKRLRENYLVIAHYLCEVGVWSLIDTDELKRYVEADALCDDYTKRLFGALKRNDLDEAEQIGRLREKAFNQAHTLANSLGLNIISRAKITRPTRDDKNEREIKM